ncbi:hypothetical protein ACQBAU_16200 [Propionibacteriaceae bacterium Y2011]
MTTQPEPGQTRPFADWIREYNRGQLHDEISHALQELATAVKDHQKAGTITVTVKIEPLKDNSDVLKVSDKVTTKVPQPDRKAAIYFADADGNLRRDNPNQPSIPGTVRAVPNSGDDVPRKVNER